MLQSVHCRAWLSETTRTRRRVPQHRVMTSMLHSSRSSDPRHWVPVGGQHLGEQRLRCNTVSKVFLPRPPGPDLETYRAWSYSGHWARGGQQEGAARAQVNQKTPSPQPLRAACGGGAIGDCHRRGDDGGIRGRDGIIALTKPVDVGGKCGGGDRMSRAANSGVPRTAEDRVAVQQGRSEKGRGMAVESAVSWMMCSGGPRTRFEQHARCAQKCAPPAVRLVSATGERYTMSFPTHCRCAPSEAALRPRPTTLPHFACSHHTLSGG